MVGCPGVGKTLFVLRFAQWCGCQRVVLTTATGPGNLPLRREVEPARAVAELVGARPPTTRRPQSLEVTYRRGKRAATVELVDTVGLTDDVHPQPDLRRGMADTLALLLASRVLLHVLDGPRLAVAAEQVLTGDGVDAHLARFAGGRMAYAALVNKLDLPGGPEGLAAVRRLWPRRTVIGISALEGWGFPAVGRFLRRALG